MDRITLRPAQARLRETALTYAAMGRRSLMASLYPGVGKTLGACDVGNALYRRGLIDGMVVLVPRVNLADQYELDWQGRRGLYDAPVLGSIVRRGNEPPFLRDPGQGGYVATYAALLAAGSPGSSIHMDFLRAGRRLLVLDEAQVLGVGPDGPRTATTVAALSDAAAFTVLLTGTPYRADGLPLLHGRYTAPDGKGARRLLPDVESTYEEGVAQGYLRPLEAILVDGYGIEALGGSEERIVLSRITGGLRRILLHPGYWEPLVDRTVEQVRATQRTDPRLCGLIAACTQRHAQEIQAYVRRSHPGMRTLIAVSDDDAAAQRNLRAFRDGGYDLLITVAMAYVGYDHRPISTVCVLTDIRHPGYVQQLLARGIRMMADMPAEAQRLHAIAPADPQMVAVIRSMRAQADAGMRRRVPQLLGGEPPSQTRPAVIVRAGALEQRAMGMAAGGDLNPQELAVMERAQRAWGLSDTSATGLAALLRLQGLAIADLRLPPGSAVSPTPMPQARTAREQELAVRRRLQALAVRCDALLRASDPGWQLGGTSAECRRVHGDVGNDRCGVTELERRLRWMESIWLPRTQAAGGSLQRA